VIETPPDSGEYEPRVSLLVGLLVASAVFFIPFALLLDSVWPGAHMGFHLLGVWAMWVIPGSIALSIATVLIARQSVLSGKISRTQFVYGALVVYAAFFFVCLLKYRGWFR
jgi:hypothetical protein